MRCRVPLFLLAGLTFACEGRSFPEPPPGVLQSADAILAGQELYETDCIICHGARGHGDGPQAKSLQPAPSDLRNLSGARAEPGYWFFRIKRGGKAEPLARPRSAMPAWGDHMSDEEIWRLVAYLAAMAEGRT